MAENKRAKQRKAGLSAEGLRAILDRLLKPHPPVWHSFIYTPDVMVTVRFPETD